jgi:hypothetical protein
VVIEDKMRNSKMGKIRQRKKGKGLGFKTNPKPLNPKPNYSSALNPAPEPFPHLSWNMPCVGTQNHMFL